MPISQNYIEMGVKLKALLLLLLLLIKTNLDDGGMEGNRCKCGGYSLQLKKRKGPCGDHVRD